MSRLGKAKRPGVDTRYTYAVGYIKALEARLISLGDMDRLLDEETQAEAIRALGEFPDYAESISGGDRELEAILEEQLQRAYHIVSELSHGSTVIKTLRLKYDFQNLKALLKARILNAMPAGFSMVGFLSEEQLVRLADERTVEGAVDEFAGEALLDALSGLEEDAAPERIETELDRFYYGLFLDNFSVNPFLKEYARRTIDLINLRTFWRCQIMEWPVERLAESLVPEGMIESAFLMSEFATPMLDLLPRIPDAAYRGMLTEASRVLQSKEDFSALDRLADDFLVKYLQPAKYYCFGIEPLVGYLVAKENEVTRLRTILHGKEKSLPEDTLQEVLRASYA